MQVHFSRLPVPCTDYTTDLKSVLDQSIRILQVRQIKIALTHIFWFSIDIIFQTSLGNDRRSC